MAATINCHKVNLTSSDLSAEKLEELRRVLPEAFSENKIDWEKLRAVLGDEIDERIEKFSFTWAGRSNAIKNVLIPSKATLSPAKTESVKFDTSENLFIEGDNLEVLKLLQKAYFEQVKMIYIDPPYNTGGDFVYRDDFATPLKNYLQQTGQVDADGNKLQTNKETSGRYHSDWLSMMYPRLKLAWNLLRDDGVIFVSIDDNEVHHLRMLLNEIFGEENFVGTLHWKRKKQPSFLHGHIAPVMEYILIYSKDKRQVEKLSLEKRSDKNTRVDNAGNQLVERVLNKGTRVKLSSEIKTIKKGVYKSRSMATEYLEDVYIENGRTINAVKIKAQFRNKQEEINRFVKSDVIFITKNYGLRRDLLPEELEREKAITDLLLDWGDNQESDSEMNAIFPEGKPMSYPKPIRLIKKLISSLNTEGEIILDFFAGSGTTAQSTLELNCEDAGGRRFVLVQLPELVDLEKEEGKNAERLGLGTVADIAKERIRRVIKGYGDDPQHIDDGFKVFKLTESNYPENQFEFDPEKSEEENKKAFTDYLSKAKQAKLFDDTKAIDVVYENVVKEGLSLNSKITEQKIGNNTAYAVTDSERQLLVCLDKKIDEKTVSELTSKDFKGKTFICMDSALDDTAKANLGLNVELKTI